jgi:hypothetical protein
MFNEEAPMSPSPEGKPDKRVQVAQTLFPIFSLEQSLRLAQGLWDDFAGKDAAPHQLALSLNMTPTSGSWRNLCGSAIAYGLTNGGYAADSISLTALGRRIVAPLSEGDDVTAKVEAGLKPKILNDFFQKYDKAKFPKDEIARNVLISMGLPKDRAAAALETLRKNGEFCGIVIPTKTGPFVTVTGGGAVKSSISTDDSLEGEESSSPMEADGHGEPPPPVPEQPSSPRQLFVAHGKNAKPLDELRKILDQFKIPYRIAIDEAHSGRPISAKVATLMRNCSAGIFIFTKDEQLINTKSETIWRPSENVVYELGAGNVLWDSKIIVLKENGVNFASDYQDIGYINFDSGELASKALDILKELVGLGLVEFKAL